MPDVRAEIMPDGAPWEWYRELGDDAEPPTKLELWKPYAPRDGAVDAMAGSYGDPLLDAPDDL